MSPIAKTGLTGRIRLRATFDPSDPEDRDGYLLKRVGFDLLFPSLQQIPELAEKLILPWSVHPLGKQQKHSVISKRTETPAGEHSNSLN